MELPDPELNASLAPALSTPIHILIVEDIATVAKWIEIHLKPLLEAFPRAQIDIVYTWKQASEYVDSETPPHVVLLDLSLPDSEMMDTIRRVPEIDKRSAVVIITGHAIEDVEKLLVDSKVEVLSKGLAMKMTDKIVSAIVRAIERKSFSEEKERFEWMKSGIKDLKGRGYATPKTES